MAKERICGIYCIENIIDNKKYIGQSVDIYNRWIQHKAELNRNHHCNERLQNAWNKYGVNNFVFYIIEKCKENNLDDLEQYYIKEFDTYYSGYNLDFGATNKVRWTDEMRKKLSDSRLNMTNEDREKCRIAHKDECIPIYQINLNGEIVSYWEYGAREASKKLNINQSCIWYCLNKNRKTYKGYIWIKESEFNKDIFDVKEYINHKNSPSFYDMYDLNNNFIKRYSYKELSEDGLDPSNVLKCANGKVKTYKNHIFKKVNYDIQLD